jgi:hypothetical protein
MLILKPTCLYMLMFCYVRHSYIGTMHITAPMYSHILQRQKSGTNKVQSKFKIIVLFYTKILRSWRMLYLIGFSVGSVLYDENAG